MPNEGTFENNGTDELLFIARSAEAALPPGVDNKIEEVISFVEGMAPFLEKDMIVKMKCYRCDNYSRSFFPLEGDFGVVDGHEYCHWKKVPLHHLSLLNLAKCTEYAKDSQDELKNLAISIISEDLKPPLAHKRMYNRNTFANHPIDFKLISKPQKAVIQLGHFNNSNFLPGDIKISIVRRLDPGFGQASNVIDEGLRKGPVIVVEGNINTVRKINLHEVLRQTGSRRKMDIVYL